jgi:diguanylate cyclase
MNCARDREAETSGNRAGGASVTAADTAVLAALQGFPSPVAVIDRHGATLLVNAALARRYGAAIVDREGLAPLLRGVGGQYEIQLRAPPRLDEPINAHALAVPLQNWFLLLLGDSDSEASPLADEVAQLRERVESLERVAATDHLTGAWNRAHFERVISAELARSHACRQPLSLVLLDLDHFKRVNDTHGHDAGDRVLRELVAVIGAQLRGSDYLFRWGGEEFAVLLGGVGYRGAERVAQKVRAAVELHEFAGVGRITLSASAAEHLGEETPWSWFQRLDRSLYSAKRLGRNQVVVDRRGNSDRWAEESPMPAMHLEWKEAYESGDATIDEQHRELFARANALIDANFTGGALASLDELLSHLLDHFVDEEAILVRLNYDHFDEHKRAHSALLKRAGWLRDRAAMGEANLGAVVEFIAQDVIARHLMTADRAFFPLLRSAA